ncbi:MAG: hydantoinase subunit beta [Thermoflexus sp.]
MALKLGVDVGGTHTDAVILTEKNELIGAAKAMTTPDVTSGVIKSIELVLEKSGVDPAEIKLAAIGTTHCLNALVQRRGLAKVAAIRLSLPAGLGVEPMMDWPAELRHAVGNSYFFAEGGYEYDGREFKGLNHAQLKEIAKVIKERRLEAAAITGQFSPIRSDQELEAARVLKEELGDSFPISLSYEIGMIGLIERENSTILNAALVPVATAAANAFEEALRNMGIYARLFFSQNDGTLMSVDYAKKYPVLTILSGPTNSIRGAGFLTGYSDAVVLDIGGTTLIAGMLVRGFPRQSSSVVEIAGIRTNFRAPDLVYIGCGGGSVVKFVNGDVEIGPESVGYELITKGLAWGGHVVTTTDISLAAGYATVEGDRRCDPSRTKLLDRSFVQRAVAKIVENVEKAIDMVKTSPEPVPVILVGGGGIIVPPDHYNKLEGASKVIRPSAFQYANAIGAAIAQVSGEVDRVFSLEEQSREEALAKAKRMAIERAVAAGADPDKVEVVEVDEIFLAYLPSNAVRVRAKAAGPLKG